MTKTVDQVLAELEEETRKAEKSRTDIYPMDTLGDQVTGKLAGIRKLKGKRGGSFWLVDIVRPKEGVATLKGRTVLLSELERRRVHVDDPISVKALGKVEDAEVPYYGYVVNHRCLHESGNGTSPFAEEGGAAGTKAQVDEDFDWRTGRPKTAGQ